MPFATAFQLCLRICHQEGPRKSGMDLNGTHQLLIYANVNMLDKNTNTIRKDTEALLEASREIWSRSKCKED
jgi:hypothetical protein